MLGDEDMAGFLNGYSALWHPAVLQGANEPPRIASYYDYESPVAGHIYALPESPQVFLPEDWDYRVREAGALVFRATADRAETLANLVRAVRERVEEERASNGEAEAPSFVATEPLLDLGPDQLRPFFGIGFGYVQLLSLFEAMDHESLLAGAEFWNDIQHAAATSLTNAEAMRAGLQSAADRLLAAREALYPVAIHVLDLYAFDERPAAAEHGLPMNLIASGQALETFFQEQPEAAARLRAQVDADQVEICLGAYCEREDGLLPLESQLWNLLKGLKTVRKLLGAEVSVFARKRFGAHAHLPLLLASAGLPRALVANFEETSHTTYHGIVVNWSAPNGKQIEAFTRSPHRADAPATFFHVAYYLHQTIAQDFVATLALAHGGKKACPWYDDWLELNRFAPVLGRWTTLTNYCNEVLSGEQSASSSAEESAADHLTERTEGRVGEPVSWFARQTRLRRRVDTVWTLAAILRGLSGGANITELCSALEALEDRAEQARSLDLPDIHTALDSVQTEIAAALADRLLSRAVSDTPGYLVLNPCNFTRRVALELAINGGPLPSKGPVKACQLDGDLARLVVEVPALGFAWIPREGTSAPAWPAKSIRLADERHVRNEYFEAAIDPATGGLRGLWDTRTQVSRVGQMLVYNPGSTMKASSIRVTSSGPALGEVISEGAIQGDNGQVLATFRQRFRAWLGRPVLELKIEIYPEQAPVGYPWHAYFGARFAWRDERALLLRGVQGTGQITSQTRPEAPDFLEWRMGRLSTTLFSGGLPFHQRHGARMLDVILVPEGEECKVFELGLGLDRGYPMQTAVGMVSPVPVVPVAKGPPHVGASGWLFHIDAANLLLTSMRPAAGADAVLARLLECAQHATQAELHCVRNPQQAFLVDARGEQQFNANVSGDAVLFDVSASDLAQLRIEFG